jgi:hypothetical protein
MSSRPGPRRPTAVLLVTVLILLTAILLVVFFVQLSNRPGGTVNIGSTEFDLGKATNIAPHIAKDGPLLLPALRGSQLNIWVQHLGSDPAHGWLAFEADAPGEARTCLLTWNGSRQEFTDPCGAQAFPADGTGLNQFATRVDQKGHVIVDLRQSIGTVPPVTAPPAD